MLANFRYETPTLPKSSFGCSGGFIGVNRQDKQAKANKFRITYEAQKKAEK
jgi:hypothetical protein